MFNNCDSFTAVQYQYTLFLVWISCVPVFIVVHLCLYVKSHSPSRNIVPQMSRPLQLSFLACTRCHVPSSCLPLPVSDVPHPAPPVKMSDVTYPAAISTSIRCHVLPSCPSLSVLNVTSPLPFYRCLDRWLCPFTPNCICQMSHPLELFILTSDVVSFPALHICISQMSRPLQMFISACVKCSAAVSPSFLYKVKQLLADDRDL